MRDEIDSRLWVEHGHLLSEQVHAFFASIMEGFYRLNAIEFAAPWRDTNPGNC